MKQSQNPLMTTMSNSLFNISGSSPSKHSKIKSKTPNLTPNRDFDKSRSIQYRSSNNFMDLSNSASISIIKRCDNTLHERLYNQAKELKEKIDYKKNEYLEHIKRESVPKIHEVSKKIERKQELFPERLYPYHKLNKLDTDEDNSFEYAHVATVRSNPLGISDEFDNDNYRNNIDGIFCDDEEIKNLYGNKPSFVKIYRGIKHPKKEKFSFKPMISKNSNKIIEKMENNFSSTQNLKRCKSNKSIDELYTRKRSIEKKDSLKNLNQENSSNNLYKLKHKNSDADIIYKLQRENNRKCNNIDFTPLKREESTNSCGRKSGNIVDNRNNNLINIDFIYNEERNNDNNFAENNNNININIQNKVKNVNASIDLDNNFEIVEGGKNLLVEYNNVEEILNNFSKNNCEIKAIINPNKFDNPAQRIKSRYEMELKKSFPSNYYNIQRNKNEKMNPKSVNISEKLYSQGLNFIKKKEKLTEEKIKSEIEEVKKHTFKPKLNNTNSTSINKTNNTSNALNYNSSNSSVNFASNNQSALVNKNNKKLVESKPNNKNSSARKNNNSNNISKYSNITHNTNNTASTQSTKKTTNYNLNNINSVNRNNNNIFSDKNNRLACKNTNINKNLNSNMNTNNTVNSNNDLKNNTILDQTNKISNSLLSKKIQNFNSLSEQYVTPHQTSAINTTLNNVNSSLFKTPAENRSCYKESSINKKLERNQSCDLTNYMNGSFYNKCQKWKEDKDQKAKKMRDNKSKEELDRCSFSPQIIKKSKNFFEEKFRKKDDMNKNNYITRMLSSQQKKEEDKYFQSKIFGENVFKHKMIITKPREFNFSQLVSRKSKENLNKPKFLHRAESVKNYREKLSTKIFFNQAVFEIEENIIDNNNDNNNFNNTYSKSNNFKINNKSPIKTNESINNNINNNINDLISPQFVNKNMNINFNVNILMNK